MLIGVDVKLKEYLTPMPSLQFSKCVKTVNAIVDNGRILSADMVVIWLTEIDLEVIYEQYEFNKQTFFVQGTESWRECS